MNTNERLHYIDQLKGLAILLVVVGHFIQSSTIESTRNLLFGFIYSFHMPLFMCISGYVAQKTVKDSIFKNYFSFLRKKAQALLIPYFTWALVVDKFFLVKTVKLDLLEPIRLIQNGSGLWFLWYLFLLYAFYSLFLFIPNRINKRSALYIDLIIFILLLTLLLVLKKFDKVNYIDSFILYFGFFFLGIFISKFTLIKKLILNRNIFLIFFLMFLVLVMHYEFDSTSIHNKIIKLFISISSIASIYYVVVTVQWNRTLDKYISLWGRKSLIIYTTHFKFINVFSGALLLPSLNIIPLICISLLFSLIVIGLSIGVANIIELSPPLNFLLYGKLIKSTITSEEKISLESSLIS